MTLRILFAVLFGFGAFGATVPDYPVTIRTNVIKVGGDIIYWHTSNYWTNAPAGTNGQVLTWTNGLPVWVTPAAGGGGGSGTVTSVGLSTTLSGLSVGSSPVTSSGTITLTGTLGESSIDAAIARDSELFDFEVNNVPATAADVTDSPTIEADLDGGNLLTFSIVSGSVDIAQLAPSLYAVITNNSFDEIFVGTLNLTNRLTTNSITLAGSPVVIGRYSVGAGVAQELNISTGLDSTGGNLIVSETAVEGFIDLQDLQGAVTDAQVPNTITIDLAATATTANSGDSATAFFSAGQIERARGGIGADTSAYGTGLLGSDGSNNTVDVDSESELETAVGVDLLAVVSDDITSANLRTLLSDETGTGAAVFAGGDIGAATATTPSAGDNDTSVATTAFIANRIDDTAYDATSWNGDTNAPTKNAVRDKIETMSAGTWDGSPIDSGTITNLTVGTINSEQFGFDSWEVVEWTFNAASTAGYLEPGLSFTAIASGALALPTGGTYNGMGNGAIQTQSGTATLNTGGFIGSGQNTQALTNRASIFGLTFIASRTNGANYRLGFSDSTSTTDPTDAVTFTMTNDVIYGMTVNNSAKAVTASGFQIQQSVPYTAFIYQTNDFSRFIIQSNVVGGANVEVFNDTITASGSVPQGASRTLSVMIGGYNSATANTNGIQFIVFDHMKLWRRK